MVLMSKANRDRATDSSFGCIAITGVVLGTVTMVVSDAFCGTGYVVAGGVSCIAFLMIRNLRVARDLSESVQDIEMENLALRESNEQFSNENERLAATNQTLKALSNELDEDLDILSDTLKVAGENRKNFMSKLRAVHLALQNENETHRTLNVQQSKLQLLQLFQHFDRNSTLTLDASELAQAIAYIKNVFPNVDEDQLLQLSMEKEVDFSKLQSILFAK